MGIYVWGTGCGASELLEAGFALDQVTAFVDSFPGSPQYLGKDVLLPSQLDVKDCQLLIVTTRHADAVAQACAQLGLPRERVLFLKNSHILTDRNAGSAAWQLLDGPLLKALIPRQHVVPTPAQLAKCLLPESEMTNDYVRLATLELLCRRLASVPGAAAELGVYRGHFAKCINTLLPDRRLYLFDSFQGFSPEAGANRAFQEAHANTAAEKVLAILPHPEQAVIKAGFFPSSLQGLEDRFCLVSLDVDFYQTTLEGLRYFWPRLSPGGYLLLHDWGNLRLPEVKNALNDYGSEIKRPLPAVPLCDLGGSLVLCKY